MNKIKAQIIIGAILFVVGLACVLAAFIWQQILCYQKFGFIFAELFIPHLSALLYLGAIPMGIGGYMLKEW